MAHFAELDENNIVTSVYVIADADCLDGDGNESEAVGVAFCESLFGSGTYKQTSYNGNIRKQYAWVGDTYDTAKDVYIRPKPHASWVLNSDNDWEAPLALPDNNFPGYDWDESAYQADNNTGWVARNLTLPS